MQLGMEAAVKKYGDAVKVGLQPYFSGNSHPDHGDIYLHCAAAGAADNKAREQ
jgi:hypothetical protein